jgi:Holliday junction resolvase RusA-like endonuclease
MKFITTITFQSAEYKKFFEDITLLFKTQTKVRLEKGEFADVKIKVRFWKMKDSDSAIKSIFDAIEEAGIIYDDKYIRDFSVTRFYHKKSELDKVQVEVIPVENKRLIDAL